MRSPCQIIIEMVIPSFLRPVRTAIAESALSYRALRQFQFEILGGESGLGQDLEHSLGGCSV